MSLMASPPRSIELPAPRVAPDPPGRYARSPRRAETFYRRAAGSAAFLSGLLVFASILMIPFDGVGSEGYLRSTAEHPDAVRWAAVVLHYGFLLLVPASFGMAYLSRRGSRSLSNLGLVLAVLGSGLSGIVAVDYYDLALVSTLPMDQAVEVYDAAGSTAGAVSWPRFRLPGRSSPGTATSAIRSRPPARRPPMSSGAAPGRCGAASAFSPSWPSPGCR